MIRSTVSPMLKIGFQLFGIWPGVSYSTVHSMSIISSILIIQYFQYLYIFKHFKISEISNLNDSLNLTFTYGLTVFKLIYLWIRRQVFHQILVAMDNDWRECINIDKHLYIMTIKANLAHFISNSILSVSTIIAIPFFLGEYIIHSVFLTEDQNNTLRPLPMKIQLPFDTQQSPIFEIVFVTLFLHSIIIFSKSIVNAAYELTWYDIPSHQSKMLILIIMRSQKQLTISAGKMMDMSFETYTNHFKISEFSNLIDGLSLTLDYSLTFVKLVSLWIHRRVFHKILAAMDNDWRECINIDEHLNMMTIKATVSHFYSNAMLSFNGVAAVLYVLGDYAIRFVYTSKDHNDTLRQLPIKVLLPFETEQSPIFELLVAIMFLHIILVSLLVAVLNGLIFTLVLHVSGQIDIICQEFKNISENAFPYQSSAFILGVLIKKHNKVYSFSENIEELFSFIALMQVVCKTLVICCLGFVIIISVHNEIDFYLFVKAAVAYIAVMIEIFIICFAGEYLSLKSKSVADAAYKSLWYDMPINQTKIISFVIMKSQRRLSITAGKMMDMSFEALTNNTQTDNISHFELLLDYNRNWNRLIGTSAEDVRTIIVLLLTRKRRRGPIPCEIMRATSISTSVEIGLRFVGIWPGLQYGTITWFAYMMSLVFALYFQYVYIFDHLDINNISNLVDALSITLAYSLGFLKLFYDIVLTMEEDWSNDNIYDKSVSCIMASNANLSRRCSNVLISINAAAAICYSVTNFLRLSTDFKEDLNISSRVLPIKMKFPFKIDVSPLFELLAVGQILHVVSIATLVGMMNCLIITLVLHVSGQIDILRRELLTICGNGISQRDSIVTSVRLVIIRHQKIITLSDNIEELYSDIALMQFLSNTVVICCIGFTIIASLVRDGATVVILKSAIFYVAVTLEAFIFCFAGEYLSAKSKSVGDAVYEALWYNMTPAECRILLFVILRSQKRLTITAGNIMDLSLEGFTSVMKASASYMSVLHAISPKMNSKTDSLKILDGTVSRSIEIGLRVIGVWPNSSFTVLRRAFWMITFTMAQTFQYRYFVIHVRTDDLSHLMDGLSTTMSYSLLLLKLTIFWLNRRIFHDILTIMSEDRSECVTEWAIYSMSRTTDVSHRSSNLIIGLYSMSVFIYGTGVLVAHSDESDEQLAVQARELFLKMELPFESNASPTYELVMITQFFHQLSAATIVGVINALIVSLILHVGGQIDIMCRGLVEISSDDTFDLQTSTIKALIRRHQRIIALSADIETLFSYIALMQFLWNTLVICCLGFLIVISIGDTQGSTMLIKSLFFYVVITLEAFIFCYAGEYLSDKGRMIGNAAYEIKWYKLNPTQSRILLLLILRSQRKLTITIGKFMELSLERFTTVRCVFRITFFPILDIDCTYL
ncbi:OR67C protein, partial [Acromyrmex heyeri]